MTILAIILTVAVALIAINAKLESDRSRNADRVGTLAVAWIGANLVAQLTAYTVAAPVAGLAIVAVVVVLMAAMAAIIVALQSSR